MRLNLLSREPLLCASAAKLKKTPQKKTNPNYILKFPTRGQAFLPWNLPHYLSHLYKPKLVENQCRELVWGCRSANSLSGLWGVRLLLKVNSVKAQFLALISGLT